MKKLIIFLCAACSLMYPYFPAYASEIGVTPTNVNITVVVPEIAAEPTPASPDGSPVFPVDVTEIRGNGGWEIIRTYELNHGENPMDIPQGSFERSGWRFTLTDIIRRETVHAETREHSETITLDTNTKEIEQILPLLSPAIDFRGADGFAGILTLDISSIQVEAAGTRRSSYTAAVTREYPRLSSNDTSFIPKTVEDRGITYTLDSVDWRVGNTITVDYQAFAEYYTAVATYTATGTRTTVTGYTTTVQYNGSLARMSHGKTFYAAHFLGEEIRGSLTLNPILPVGGTEIEPSGSEPAAEPTPESSSPPVADDAGGGLPSRSVLLAIGLCLVVLAGGICYFIDRKGRKNEEPDDLAPDDDPVDDSATDDSGDGS
jgi:hypothetical protein